VIQIVVENIYQEQGISPAIFGVEPLDAGYDMLQLQFTFYNYYRIEADVIHRLHSYSRWSNPSLPLAKYMPYSSTPLKTALSHIEPDGS
jgi:hypothetical protein